MTDDALIKVAMGIVMLASAGALVTATIGIRKPQAEAKPSVSSETVINALHGPVFRKSLAHWRH